MCLCDECIINHTINSVGDPHRGGTSISYSHKSFEVLSVYTLTRQRFCWHLHSMEVPISWWVVRWKKLQWLPIRLTIVGGKCARIMLITLNEHAAIWNVFSGHYPVIMVLIIYLLICNKSLLDFDCNLKIELQVWNHWHETRRLKTDFSQRQ